MCSLKVPIQEQLEHEREQAWRRAGVPERDILFSRLSGIDAADVQTFRESSLEGLLFVVRCPKVAARAWHGVLPPKNAATKAKTGSSGVVVTDAGRLMVSDYDLMCVWRRAGAGYEKVFMSAADGAPRGRWSPEAVKVAVALNRRLVSRIQHGCQDDFHSPRNPGVKRDDHFAAFRAGTAQHLPDPDACARFYREHGLVWPYDAGGRFTGG